MNSGLATFTEALRSDTTATKRVEGAIVSFGPVQTVQYFVTADAFQVPTLVASGDTPMGAAIQNAVELVAECKAAHKANGIGYERPGVFAITDGAPTDRGADIVVETVVQYLSHVLDAGRSEYRTMLRDAAAVACEAVLPEAQRHGSAPRELASPLLIVVVGPRGGDALQIGDGVLVVSDGGTGWDGVFWPPRGEDAHTTHCQTDEDATERLQVGRFSGKVTDDGWP